MPRVKLTRLILFVVIIFCLMLLVVNVWFEWNSITDSNTNYSKSEDKRQIWSKTLRDEQKDKEVNIISDEISDKDVIRSDYRIDMTNDKQTKPWFMTNGTLRPDPRISSTIALWPEESNGDRIVNQLMFYPKHYDPMKKKLKTILLYMGRGGWADLPMGRTKFISDKCPVDRCYLSTNPKDADDADALFFKERFQWPRHRRPAHQIWILFLLECPLHTQLFRNLGKGVFNWTATYRHDSDIVAPYENCGNKKCPRNRAKQCFQMLNRDYRFYLAFENSNCRDYITEKFFVNGLGHNSMDYNLIPIVMGAHPNDYLRASPHKSYIHIDDFESPQHLAQYLHRLSADPSLYNQYFEWKSSGEFINTFFWCRICALLHSDHQKPSHSYEDISKWWAPQDVCNNGKNKWTIDQSIS